MAFFMRYGDPAGGKNVTWHVQSAKPLIPVSQYDSNVFYFMADGDELGYIMLRLRNIPITHGGICVWRGDWAQFIYDNL